ncbi:MAG: hypothetical protein ACJASL_000485 [Paraglaciecola sp.]|jgi:hypothetical protein
MYKKMNVRLDEDSQYASDVPVTYLASVAE